MQNWLSGKKINPNPKRRPTKVQPQTKETVLKGVEVVEFTPSPKRAKGTPTPPDNSQGLMDIDSDVH